MGWLRNGNSWVGWSQTHSGDLQEPGKGRYFMKEKQVLRTLCPLEV